MSENPKNRIRAQLDSFSMTFLDGEMEKNYWEWNFPERFWLLRRNLLLAAFFNILYIIFDIDLRGFKDSIHLILMRASLSILIVVSYFFISRIKNPATTDLIIKSLSFMYFIGISILLYFIRDRGFVDGSVLIVIILIYYFFIPQKFLLSVVMGIGTSISFLIIIHYFYNLHIVTYAMIASSFLISNLICTLYLHNVHYQKRKEYFDYINELQYQVLLEGEIRKKKVVEGKLRKLAETDSLTGILNRRSFIQAAEREFARSARYKKPFSMILFDLDHFKKVNDTYGHARGDELLKSLARITEKNIRESDYFSRFGGEEFIVLMPETKKKNAQQAAEKLRGVFEKSQDILPGGFTASFGVAESKSNQTLNELIRSADKAMYLAKQNGRNRVETV